jgi:hypothetical protein
MKRVSALFLSGFLGAAWTVFLFIDDLRMRTPGLRRLGLMALVCGTLFLFIYWISQRLWQVFRKFPVRQQAATILFSFLLAGLLIVMIPVVLNRFFYALLPAHTLIISVDGDQFDQVEILQFNTAAGNLDPAHSLKVSNGGFAWRGKVGDKAALVFKPVERPVLVTVSWDGLSQQVDLSAAAKREAVFVNQNFPVPWLHGFVWFVCVWVSLASVAFVATVLLIAIRWEPVRGGVRWPVYAIPMILVWAVYLLTFWPGFMSPDSLMQWGEVQSGQFSDAHPALHSMFIWLLSRLWNTPAMLVIFHILLLSLLTAWGLGELQKRGVSPVILWMGALLFALFPVNGLLVISVWKDITYACALFAIFLQFVKIYFSDGKWLKNNWNLAGFVLAGLTTAFVRHNGLPVVFASLVVLLLVYRENWRRILASVAILFLFWAGISGPLYSVLNVKRYPGFTNILFLDHIDAHIHAGTRLMPDEKAFLESLLPLSDWPYNCADSDIRKMDGPIPFDYFTQTTREPARIAINLFLRDPLVDIQHTLCSSSLVWKVNTGHYISIIPFTQLEDGSYGWVVENDFGLVEQPLFPGLIPFLTNQFSDKGLLAKPAFYLLVAIFVFAILAIRQRNARLLVISMPLVLQTGIMLLVTYAQDFRYLFSTVLIALFSLVMLFLPESTEKI